VTASLKARSPSTVGPVGAGPVAAGRDDRPALEHLLEERLRDLAERGSCHCPVCGGLMRREGRAGRCTDCGSGLA
jgi:tRNA(Ile2) C34 agmatinyltransferase TiaS